eukprot:CAMPEP_0184696734 /NCGR_PEP_ID=MMETSP0313-20130426/3938_1 /TAXON_ID=2792 /ORGANISM="Porphyridium aerugineum, Strain SAG 1380-2" /LENGTH=255 /DNA_ID=CAMNT_0027155421 /DNA_START=29 /DNA_END=796 /DNA_ORIENTATION=+
MAYPKYKVHFSHLAYIFLILEAVSVLFRAAGDVCPIPAMLEVGTRNMGQCSALVHGGKTGPQMVREAITLLAHDIRSQDAWKYAVLLLVNYVWCFVRQLSSTSAIFALRDSVKLIGFALLRLSFWLNLLGYVVVVVLAPAFMALCLCLDATQYYQMTFALARSALMYVFYSVDDLSFALQSVCFEITTFTNLIMIADCYRTQRLANGKAGFVRNDRINRREVVVSPEIGSTNTSASPRETMSDKQATSDIHLHDD